MLSENPAFHYWIYLAVFFFVKMFANSLMQGRARSRGNNFKYAEDTKTFGSEGEADPKYADLELRASNCWKNDLENIPMFLLLGLALVLLGASANVCLVYFLSYGVFRLLHTILLIKAKQPHRAVVFVFGILTTLAVGIHCIYLTL